MLPRCNTLSNSVLFLFLVLSLILVNRAQNRAPSSGAIRVSGNSYDNVFRPVPMQPPPPPKDPNVKIVPRLGEIRGQIDFKKIGNRGINAYRNLKYAVVRNGLGRFQKAIPINYEYSNKKIISAESAAPNCPQFPDLPMVNESEARGVDVDDCLTLNVYAPNKPGLYPIIVFVHGEMLFDGTAEEGQPDYFLEHDVVLVTVNYRLAPFGFLTTLTDEMPGNVALSDLALALEWIQQYIRPLGGNPDEVTLLGQAGGATLAHALSLANRTRGLFHKLILQSGTALNPYFLDENPVATARNFANLARCPIAAAGTSRELQSLNECFGRMSTTHLLQVMERFWEENEPRGLRFTGGFKLVVGDRLGFLEQHPAALVVNNQTHYPMIAGVTKDAGAFIMSREMFKQLKDLRSSNMSDYINVALKHIAPLQHHKMWHSLAMRSIFDSEDMINPSLTDIAQGILELVNLILYRGPIIDSIRYSSKKNPTYLYCFDYRGEYHRFGHLSNPLPFATDATLSDDSIYLFPYPIEVSQLNNEDLALSRAIVSMWVNFAQYNIPNLNPGVWPNVTTEYGPFVRFTNSKTQTIELDYHFGEGIPVPNLYSVNATTTTSTTTTTTTRRPLYNAQNYYQRPRPYETVLNNGETSLQRPNSQQEYRQPYNYHPRYPNHPNNG